MTVPPRLARAAEWGWRILVVAAAVLALALLLSKLRIVVVPVILALFFCALLRPPRAWLGAKGLPPALAALLPMLAALSVLAGLIALLVPPFITQVEALGDDLADGVERAGDWLVDGPVGLTEDQLDQYVSDVANRLEDSSAEIAGGILSGAQVAAEIAIGLLIALVLTFFFLKDGDRIWSWIVGLFASSRQEDVREVGRRAWGTLAGYLRGITVVALVDAVFIGLALLLLDVPGALALAVFTFFGAYIPIAGAVVTGLVAVLVALIANGLVTALLVLAAVVIVQQAESNLLHPVVVGRAVAVHPVAILLAVVTGAVLAGIIGAFIAVPVVAVGARIGSYVRERSAYPERETETEAERETAPLA